MLTWHKSFLLEFTHSISHFAGTRRHCRIYAAARMCNSICRHIEIGAYEARDAERAKQTLFSSAQAADVLLWLPPLITLWLLTITVTSSAPRIPFSPTWDFLTCSAQCPTSLSCPFGKLSLMGRKGHGQWEWWGGVDVGLDDLRDLFQT